MWIVFAVGSALFAGITAILAKVGIRDVNAHLATALRTAVVLLFAWIVVWLVGSQVTIGEISAKSFLFLGLSGLTSGGSWICYFRALQLGDVNKVTPIDKSSTILTMLLAFLLLGEPLTAIIVCGMALMAVGTWLMIKRQKTDIAPAGPERTGNRKWLIYAALAAVFASLTSILGKIGVENVESNLATALRTMVVLIMAWLIVLPQGLHRDIRRIDRKSWVFLVLSGLATGLSWLCYYRALQIGPASLVVPIDKLSIVVTVACSYFFLREKIGVRALIGLLLIVGGTLLLLVKI